jgi:hypothetical protein
MFRIGGVASGRHVLDALAQFFLDEAVEFGSMAKGFHGEVTFQRIEPD